MEDVTSVSKRPRAEEEENPVDDLALASAVLESASQSQTSRPTKRARVGNRSSLFVRSLPPNVTGESLAVFFSEHCPVKHATVVIDPKTKTSRGYGFVTLADPDDAGKVKESLNNTQWEGRNLKIEIAEPRQRGNLGGATAHADESNKSRKAGSGGAIVYEKPPKLIVRNLPWSIKDSGQLSALFRSFGKIKFADLPQSKGKLSGFGFVTIRGKKNAHKAVEMMNGKVIDGRTIAVDWAVDKDEWEKQKPAEAAVDQQSQDDPADDADEDLKNFMANHMQNLEDEDENADPPSGEKDREEEEHDTDDDNTDDNDGDSEKAWSDVSDDSSKPKVATKTPQTTDNKSTVFVRNLPFTVTDEQLATFFCRFGRVRYARTVLDRTTDRPAGTGFVCFFSEADARACVVGAPRIQAVSLTGKRSVLQDEAADPAGIYTLEGRVLSVAQAVSKEDASKLSSGERTGKKEDRRRLFLLSEGSVDTRSTLYALLTPSEIKARENSVAHRKRLVQKNPNLRLSLTRLAVRNLPRNIRSKDLKELARKAVVGFAGDAREGRRQPLSREESRRDGVEGKEADRRRKEKRKGIVHQCKVVFETREGSKTSEAEGGKSRGYGFIEYTTHRSALMGLRWLNGHSLQGENGKKTRLMVEFAIENSQVVTRRKTSEQKTARQTRPHEASASHIPSGQQKQRPADSAAAAAAATFKAEAGTGHKTEAKAASKLQGKKKNRKKGDDGAAKGTATTLPASNGSIGKTSVKALKHGGGGKGDGKEDLKRQLVVRQRLVRKKKMAARGRNA